MAHVHPDLLAQALADTDTDSEPATHTHTAYYSDTDTDTSSSSEDDTEAFTNTATNTNIQQDDNDWDYYDTEDSSDDDTPHEHTYEDAAPAHEEHHTDAQAWEQESTDSSNADTTNVEYDATDEYDAGDEYHDYDRADEEEEEEEEERVTNENAYVDYDEYGYPIAPPTATTSNERRDAETYSDDEIILSDTDDESWLLSGRASPAEGGEYISRGPNAFTPLPPSTVASFVADVTPHLTQQRALVSAGRTTSATALIDTLYGYARAHELVSGKYLIFAQPHIAAALWADVRSANAAGRLGGVCELRASTSSSGEWLVAAHVPDWTDSYACEAVASRLADLCARHAAKVAAFKPALLTAAGIYADRRAEYTAADLAMRALPSPLRAPARRRRKRGGNGAAGQYYQEHVHYHGKWSEPSLPNGAWSHEEVSQGWVYHMSRPAHERGRGGTRGESSLQSRVCHILDTHAARVYSGEHVSSSERTELCASLWACADEHDAVVGKWKVFAPARVADDVWRALCDANDAGLLGGCIKLGPYNARSGGFLICVYCNDFANVDDCTRVLREAARCCAPSRVRIAANFKPDFMSSVGVYRSTVRGHAAPYALDSLGLSEYWPRPALRHVLALHRRETRAWM